MLFVNPDPYLLPTYRMSPFTTDSITFNQKLPNDHFAVDYFDQRFGQGNWSLTANGRQGIEEALKSYNLSDSDVVTIVTTSQNLYISSCVTSTIEKICKWNREICTETKVILVNHEFGFPFKEMEELVKLGIPIIEDCCTTFFSQDKNQKIGHYGDFSIYSFPKIFPIQVGGLLVSNRYKLDSHELIANDMNSYLVKIISNQIKNSKTLINKRTENYKYAISIFKELGFEERFKIDDLIVPYALVLKNNGIVKNLNQLKIFFNKNGIQNSVFYGEDAYFIPNHQNISFTDIDLFKECLLRFIKQQ